MKAFQKISTLTSFEGYFAAKTANLIAENGGKTGTFWNNRDAMIETVANSPFERNGVSLLEKRHIANRETAFYWQRMGFSLA